MKFTVEIDTEKKEQVAELQDLLCSILGKGKKTELIELAHLIDGSLSTKTANVVRSYMHKNEGAIQSISDLEYHVLVHKAADGAAAQREILTAIRTHLKS